MSHAPKDAHLRLLAEPRLVPDNADALRIEHAWLVEWRFNGVQWLYLWPSAPGGFSFTADPNSALRFARREDAEACLAWACEVDRRRGAGVAGGELLVTEHEWLAGAAAPQGAQVPLTEPQIDSLRGLDTASRVRFYEHDFYVLSNFSAFTLQWKGIRFDTSEAAYHWEKFTGDSGADQLARHFILTAPSAHEAYKVAEHNKAIRRPDWNQVRVGIMLDILRAKAQQHEYVRRKLLATGERELVEDSWRDDFWGWGPNRDGRNMLGKLWMQVRSELRGITEQEKPHG